MFSVDAREGLRENKRVRKSERHSVMPVSHVCVCASSMMFSLSLMENEGKTVSQ